MDYTVVIRTLGTAGEKYQRELDSVCAQTIPPKAIIVYIAEGYPIPKETCGLERYVYVKKGMMSQRAQIYSGVETEWILCLDDDLYMPSDAVETMFNLLKKNEADVISPDIYHNHKRGIISEFLMTLSGRMCARRGDNEFGYKVMNTGGFSYNKNPKRSVLMSNTNAGACFLCRKTDLLSIRLFDELWIDRLGYAIGDDQIMYYKMYLKGFKQLTYYNSGIEHLDGGANIGNKEKETKLVMGDYFFRRVFFNRFLLEPESSAMQRLWKKICITYFYSFGLLVSFVKLDFKMLHNKLKAIKDANSFLKSTEYSKIPKI